MSMRAQRQILGNGGAWRGCSVPGGGVPGDRAAAGGVLGAAPPRRPAPTGGARSRRAPCRAGCAPSSKIACAPVVGDAAIRPIRPNRSPRLSRADFTLSSRSSRCSTRSRSRRTSRPEGNVDRPRVVAGTPARKGWSRGTARCAAASSTSRLRPVRRVARRRGGADEVVLTSRRARCGARCISSTTKW